jgi:hypothetical protein
VQLVERRVRVPRGYSEVEVILAGCLHVGHRASREHEIRDMVEYVAAAPNRRLVLMGDVTDSINISDPRFSPAEVAPWIATEDLSNRLVLEAERAVDILSPIRNQIDAIVCGNHENRPKRNHQVDLHRILTDGLGAPSMGLLGFLRYTFVGRDRGESAPVVFYLEHGVGVVLNKMVKRAKDFPGAHVVAGAHHHRNGATTAETVQYDSAAGKIVHGSTLCVTVGTFLRYHLPAQTSYGEMFNMDPHGIGPGKVRVKPWAKKEGDRVGYSFPYWS